MRQKYLEFQIKQQNEQSIEFLFNREFENGRVFALFQPTSTLTIPGAQFSQAYLYNRLNSFYKINFDTLLDICNDLNFSLFESNKITDEIDPNLDLKSIAEDNVDFELRKLKDEINSRKLLTKLKNLFKDSNEIITQQLISKINLRENLLESPYDQRFKSLMFLGFHDYKDSRFKTIQVGQIPIYLINNGRVLHHKNFDLNNTINKNKFFVLGEKYNDSTIYKISKNSQKVLIQPGQKIIITTKGSIEAICASNLLQKENEDKSNIQKQTLDKIVNKMILELNTTLIPQGGRLLQEISQTKDMSSLDLGFQIRKKILSNNSFNYISSPTNFSTIVYEF